MSGVGAQLAPEPERPPFRGTLPNARSPLAHLLHALNQPLTGLQCSLELAAASPRRREEYVRIMREGLELIGRMRILVEGIRELVDQPDHPAAGESFEFGELLKQTIEGLAPVAESKDVRLALGNAGPLILCGDRRSMATHLFRLLESALSLARVGSELSIGMVPASEPRGLVVTWKEGPAPAYSPFSRQELGLLIAQAGFERTSAVWTLNRRDATQTCTVRLPSACSELNLRTAELEI